MHDGRFGTDYAQNSCAVRKMRAVRGRKGKYDHCAEKRGVPTAGTAELCGDSAAGSL